MSNGSTSKVIPFGDLLTSLQNLGEVNVKLSMHATDEQESGGALFRREQAVCFYLDPEKEDKKNKKAGEVYNHKGSKP